MSSDSTKILLPDGRVTSGRWDDFEAVGDRPTEKIVVADRADQVHDMPETWLRARVRGWMNLTVSPDMDFWIGTYTSNGSNSRWIYCSSRDDTYVPLLHRVDYARRVCRGVNQRCANGGAWLAGWIRGGHEFYLLWKEADGDLAVNLECDKPFTHIVGWTIDDWAQHCVDAMKLQRDWTEAMELTNGQVARLAQGQRMDEQAHLQRAPEQTIQLP
jgi:hypothetical protein